MLVLAALRQKFGANRSWTVLLPKRIDRSNDQQ